MPGDDDDDEGDLGALLHHGRVLLLRGEDGRVAEVGHLAGDLVGAGLEGGVSHGHKQLFRLLTRWKY